MPQSASPDLPLYTNDFRVVTFENKYVNTCQKYISASANWRTSRRTMYTGTA